MEKRRFYFFIIINCFLLCAIFLTILHSEFLLKKYSDEMITLKSFTNNGQPDDMCYRVLTEDDPETYVFTTTIPRGEFERLDSNSYKMVVYRLVGHWYKVYFNGNLIGTAGNLVNDRSNIWNSLHTFDIDNQLLKEVNVVTFVVYGTYEVGRSTFPIFITRPALGGAFEEWFSLAFLNIYYIIIGTIIFAFLFIIFLFKPANKLKQDLLYFSISVLAVLVFLLDYIPLNYLPISYLYFKKLIIFAMYFAVFAMSEALYKRFHRRINIILGHILLFSSIFILVFVRDIVTFKNTYDVLNMLVTLNILGWLYAPLKSLRKSVDAKIIFQASLFMLFLSGYDVVNMLNKQFSFVSLTVYGTLQFSLAMVTMIIFDYLDLQRKVMKESEKSKLMYQRAVRDGMTGLHNHQYIHHCLQRLRRSFTMVMLDIDNFKHFNDTYGHQAGDLVIKFVAEKIDACIRQLGIAGRYGGDEFVLLFLKCSPKKAREIVSQLRSEVGKPFTIDAKTEVKVNISIGVYTSAENEDGEQALSKSDKALYYSKNHGKNCITDYSEINLDSTLI